MDRVYEIADYFPRHISDTTLRNYVEHHVASLVKCVENELYSSAYSHMHLLYMAFIYLQILRISQLKEAEFRLCWIGFPVQEKDFLREPTSPFSFSSVNEKSVFRFFRLIGFEDGDVGDLSSIVKTRNDRLHASGVLFCENEEQFETEMNKYLEKMNTTIIKQADFLSKVYDEVINTYDEEFIMNDDEIETSFEDRYYFSPTELKLLSNGRQDRASLYIVGSYL